VGHAACMPHSSLVLGRAPHHVCRLRCPESRCHPPSVHCMVPSNTRCTLYPLGRLHFHCACGGPVASHAFDLQPVTVPDATSHLMCRSLETQA
jgi:hypothetical protein